jgi:MFS family permease
MLVRPYAALLRDNPHFARLWYAQIVSLLGDWFNTIVLSALVAAYSDDSGLAISLLLLARFLPPLLVGPAAGVLLDRFDRRRLLIASDLLRTVIVLGFLLADRPDRLWLIYALTVAQFSLSALFEPGRSALTPRLVRSGQLTEANILGTMTWSVILAVGGVLGGVISTLFGTQIALVFDASTFLLSAWLISLIPPALGKVQPQASGEPGNGVSPPSLRDFTDGVRYAADHPETGAVLLVKLGGSVGSLDALLIIYATTYFVLGEGGSLSLGLLWTAFGLGAVMGPLVAASASDGTVRTMRRWIIGAYGFIFAGWIVFAADRVRRHLHQGHRQQHLLDVQFGHPAKIDPGSVSRSADVARSGRVPTGDGDQHRRDRRGAGSLGQRAGPRPGVRHGGGQPRAADPVGADCALDRTARDGRVRFGHRSGLSARPGSL